MFTMQAYGQRIEKAREALSGAEKIILGAGAGLSTAAGLDYSGERFAKSFSDFAEKYGFTDMYTSGFYPFRTQNERWAYWARHCAVNRFDVPAMPLYRQLLELVKGKDYFVLTTNVDAQFEKAGFSPERIFATQGDYGFIQCAKGCHPVLYPFEADMRKMLSHTENCAIPTNLIPKCPVCGGEMCVHLRSDDFFVEDEAWHEASNRYNSFLAQCESTPTVLLEIGVGYNTPGIIRYPFEILCSKFDNITLIRINLSHPFGFEENEEHSVIFNEDTEKVISDLREV